jgi:hypothetical protein
MNDISLRKLTSLLRKSGIPCSAGNGSRISGWCNSLSEGYDIGNFYPWTTYWVRDGYRRKSTIDKQDVLLSYTTGFTMRGSRTNTKFDAVTGFDAIKKVLDDNGIAYEITKHVDSPALKVDVTRI